MKINELIAEKTIDSKQVVVVSPFVLTQEQIMRLRDILHLSPDLNLRNEVDKQVIAGFVIRIGSLIIDLSLKTKLREFYKRLYENI